MSNINFEAAEELWELWEDYKSIHPFTTATDEQEAPTEVEAPSQAVKPSKAAPAMINSGSSGSGSGSSTKPMYSQQALNRMQQADPELFWASDTQAKIQSAYAEGRVQQD